MCCDDTATVWLNQKRYQFTGHMFETKVTIREGTNVVETYVLNIDGLTYGFILSIVDDDGKVIVNTDGTWKWYFSEANRQAGRHL